MFKACFHLKIIDDKGYKVIMILLQKEILPLTNSSNTSPES